MRIPDDELPVVMKYIDYRIAVENLKVSRFNKEHNRSEPEFEINARKIVLLYRDYVEDKVKDKYNKEEFAKLRNELIGLNTGIGTKDTNPYLCNGCAECQLKADIVGVKIPEWALQIFECYEKCEDAKKSNNKESEGGQDGN